MREIDIEMFCAGNLNPTLPPPTLPTNINYGIIGVIKIMDPFFCVSEHNLISTIKVQDYKHRIKWFKSLI